MFLKVRETLKASHGWTLKQCSLTKNLGLDLITKCCVLDMLTAFHEIKLDVEKISSCKQRAFSKNSMKKKLILRHFVLNYIKSEWQMKFFRTTVKKKVNFIAIDFQQKFPWNQHPKFHLTEFLNWDSAGPFL